MLPAPEAAARWAGPGAGLQEGPGDPSLAQARPTSSPAQGSGHTGWLAAPVHPSPCCSDGFPVTQFPRPGSAGLCYVPHSR